jgi:hypothetical protein
MHGVTMKFTEEVFSSGPQAELGVEQPKDILTVR